MDWENIDWELLARLRSQYLDAPTGGVADYWESPEALRQYDFTFGQRIAWKWRAALEELGGRGWDAGAFDSIIDWGCGSGIAHREYLACFPGASTLWLSDRSALAKSFAVERARELDPALRPADIREGMPNDPSRSLVLVSHVMTELNPAGLSALRTLLAHSAGFVWVEAGTSEVSRSLSRVRDSLFKDFSVVAPCTHEARCGMLAPQNERHWCHRFADPPGEIFADPGWREFSQRLGVDLRSLPLSYLAMVRRDVAASRPVRTGWATGEGLARVIGEARTYKGYSKVLTCDKLHGVAEFMVQKRDDPDLVRALKKGLPSPFLRAESQDGRILASRMLAARTEEPESE